MADLVYSTTGGKGKKKKDSGGKGYQQGSGPCKVRLEKKGRGGKVVTVVSNIPLPEAEAKALMKECQNQLACGGTFKNSQMEFRGDLADKVIAILTGKGLKAHRAGG